MTASGLGDRMAHGPVHRDQEIRAWMERDRADGGTRNDEAEGVDRVGGIGRQDHVAGAGDRLGEIGETLLRAQRHDRLAFRIDLDIEAAAVIGGESLAQTLNTARIRIAMRARVLQRLSELIADMFGRRLIRIAHAEIDDVASGGTQGGLQLVHLGEHVRRQALGAVELGVHG